VSAPISNARPAGTLGPCVGMQVLARPMMRVRSRVSSMGYLGLWYGATLMVSPDPTKPARGPTSAPRDLAPPATLIISRRIRDRTGWDLDENRAAARLAASTRARAIGAAGAHISYKGRWIARVVHAGAGSWEATDCRDSCGHLRRRASDLVTSPRRLVGGSSE